MARQIIDTTTNNGTYIGDPAKTAFEKTNANFLELYNFSTTYYLKTGGTITGNVQVQSPNGVALDLFSTSTNVTRVQITNGSVSGRAYQLYSSGSSGPTVSGSFGLYDASEGVVVFSIDPGSRIFRMNGPMNAVSFNPTSTSDVKDYIEGYTGDACEAIDKLVVISYKYRPEYIESDKTFIGLLEENVKSVVPDAANDSAIVVDKDEGQEVERLVPGNIDMMQLLSLSIRAHQQKNKKIKELESKISEMFERMELAGI